MRQGPVYPGPGGSERRQRVLAWMEANGLDPLLIPEGSRVIITGNRITWQELVTRYQAGGRRAPVITHNSQGEAVWHLRRRWTRLRAPLEARP